MSAISFASTSEKPSTPHFAAEYGARPGAPMRPPHRRELDDVASTLLAHYGYRGFRDDDRSEQVCFDLPPEVRELRLFNRIHVA
ncbi:MAG: hypothetical protein JWO52_5892 [Gammaproteobacteria bacterium]|jgi:hypothetical protein|nr:hypothetical protein [Gammaproteobacteria bacterium]